MLEFFITGFYLSLDRFHAEVCLGCGRHFVHHKNGIATIVRKSYGKLWEWYKQVQMLMSDCVKPKYYAMALETTKMHVYEHSLCSDQVSIWISNPIKKIIKINRLSVMKRVSHQLSFIQFQYSSFYICFYRFNFFFLKQQLGFWLEWAVKTWSRLLLWCNLYKAQTISSP